MSSFRTTIKIPPSDLQINHQSVCWSIGSCFAENIGQQLLDDKFQLVLNPMGIIYNPISITKTIRAILSNKQYGHADLFLHEGQWHSFHHHGLFSNTDADQCLAKINAQLKEAQTTLPQLKIVLLTLGSANCFQLTASNEIVANCHRRPNQEFTRIRLSPKQIISELKTALEQLKATVPNVRVLLTVSPVRYLRDGLVESSRSKASLLLAVDALTEQLDFVSYFPAYELVTDELRDYRFYDTDMAHPNQLAIDFVYGRFQETHMSKETIDLTDQLRQLKQAMTHRPRNADSDQHKAFKAQQYAKVQRLEEHYPYLDFVKELQYFGG